MATVTNSWPDLFRLKAESKGPVHQTHRKPHMAFLGPLHVHSRNIQSLCGQQANIDERPWRKKMSKR